MKIDVTPNDRGGYAVVDEHGNHLPAVHMCLDQDGARVQLLVRKFVLHGVEVAHWDGLDAIPTTALVAELARRGETIPF